MKGRKPKPAILKALHGSDQPRNPNEPLAEGPLTENATDCPDYFSVEQREAWEYAVRHSPPGMLKRIDAPLLETWVIAYCALRDAAREYAKSGAVSQQGRASPLFTAIKNMSAAMRAAATELGFSPVSRTRINNLVAGEALGPAAAQNRGRDAPSQSLDDFLAGAPQTSPIN